MGGAAAGASPTSYNTYHQKGGAEMGLLGKLEHTWAKPFFGQISVRLQRISMKLGGIFSPRCARGPGVGPGAGGGPKIEFLSWGGGGPMYAIVYPALDTPAACRHVPPPPRTGPPARPCRS